MNIVKELRRKKGIQQKEFAIDIGVSSPTVSAWETGKSDPSGKHLKKISEYFGVDELTVLGRGVVDLSVPPEDDAWEIREQLRRDPNMRLLFDAASRATPEHLRAAAAMLKALEPKDGDGDD